MRVRFSERAHRSVREKRSWWEQHRDKAPGLFVEELAEVIGKLRRGADHQRQQFNSHGGQVVWRLLMPKTRHHVYYQIEETGDVLVLLVWNAQAGTEPRVL